MAFGKKSENLGNVGSFRQTAGAWNRSKQNRASMSDRGSSGSSVPSWVNEYKAPTDDLDLIRLIAGSYMVDEPAKNPDGSYSVNKIGPLCFYPYTEHYDSRTKRRANCSAGPFGNIRDRRDPCYGCDHFWSSMKPGANGKMERGYMGKSERVAFTIIHYHNYHKVPQVDKDGNPRVSASTQQQYYSWYRCNKNAAGRGKCDYCASGFEMKFGHKLHWAMGNDHANTLLDKESEISESCVNCRGDHTIVSDAWVCSDKSCGEAIIDDTSALSQKEIAQLINAPCRCPGCKNMVMASEVIHCTNCSEGRRAGLFDVDLKVKRVTPQDGTNRTILSISSYVLAPIPAALIELATPEKLDRIYAPTSLETQAALFGVPTAQPVRTPVTGETASRPYAK